MPGSTCPFLKGFENNSHYRPGMYVVEMLQGNNRKKLKLVKQLN